MVIAAILFADDGSVARMLPYQPAADIQPLQFLPQNLSSHGFFEQ
jgi:hypothetical protein